MSVLGIDLGTTYSCVAKCDQNGLVQTVTPTNQSDPSVPSVVYFDNNNNGTPIVGSTAKSNLIGRPDSTIDVVKREMDKEYCEKELLIGGVKRKVSPLEISACILNHLFKSANEVLVNRDRSAAATQAVISIPAGYNSRQREKTKLAAELAGINVIGLIQEPTAAAISYNIREGETVLVFDLGGGTLDVSIVKNEGRNYKILGSPSGDINLGGKDWDEAMVRHALRQIARDPDSLDRHGRDWAKLMKEAESKKKELSDAVNTCFEMPQYDEIVDISRFEFERITAPLVGRCINIVHEAIDNANKPNINRFVLVGGSSRMPMIKNRLIDEFRHTYSQGRRSDEWIVVSDPDQAIAKGAARYAGMLLNGNVPNNLTSPDGILTIIDKCPFSYGTDIFRDNNLIIQNLIFRSDPLIIPRREFKFFTSKENQTSVSFWIVENNRDEKEFEYTDEPRLKEECLDLPSGLPKGTEINCEVSRDSNGIVHVNATYKENELKIDVKSKMADNGVSAYHESDIIISQTMASINKMNSTNH